MAECEKCSKELIRDEVGICRKLINRGTNKFMCLECLGEYFGVSVGALKDKIEQYRSMGCTLFK